MGIFSFTNYCVNYNNLIHNVNYIRSGLNDNVKLCAVVKANAYGVGAGKIVEMIKGKVDAFAVANLDEGLAVREIDKDAKIIVLGCANLNNVDVYSENILCPTVSGVCVARKLSSRAKKPLSVEFGLNTGMNRVGFSKKAEILQAISVLHENKNITISGVYSHLATKQNDRVFMLAQKRKFDHLLTAFDGLDVCRHLSNTSASLHERKFNYDMVRVGFGLYGMGSDDENLRRVISIETRVVELNRVQKNGSVGYDRTYCAENEKIIAVLPIGYYDGFARGLSNKGCVLINGKRAPVVGRVCMDMTMVDVTDIEGVCVGTLVTIIGKQGGTEVSLGDHARLLETSEYEVLSRFNNSRMNIIIEKF